MGASAQKVCVVCGEDCTHSPRVKDPRGRYFCKPCYAEQLRRAKKKKAVPAACPDCNAALDDGAVLCVNCGYVLRSGEHLTPQVLEGDDAVLEDVVEEASSSRTKWPTVIGVFSLILAGAGVLAYGLASVASVLTSPADAGGPLFWAFSVVMHPILLGSSMGLGILAVGLIRRQGFAPPWLVQWAWVKAGVSVLYVAVFVLRGVTDAEALAESGLPPELATMGVVAFVVAGLIVLLWLLFWPVILILWLRRKPVQAEVAAWSGSSSEAAAS